MEYIYLIENNANNNITLDMLDLQIDNTLNILCYNITTEGKYPFMQFMTEKIPFCKDIVKEQFILPYAIINDLSSSISLLVLEKIKQSLNNIGCNGNKVLDSMYKGIVYDNCNIPYALINITGIDISGLNLYRTTSIWFALPTEIINIGEICNIEICDEMKQLFIHFPELGILRNSKTNDPFMLPDAVYTGGDYKNVILNSVFGNNKTKVYESCRDYYYFYRSFNDAIKEGGWVKDGGSQTIDNDDKNIIQGSSNRMLVKNEYGRYIKGGINRYALFPEGNIHIEINKELSLSDNDIEVFYPEPVLIICYSETHNIKPDVLVKDYDYFASLSYHILDKSLLGESCII
jgi:hypothetical protein